MQHDEKPVVYDENQFGASPVMQQPQVREYFQSLSPIVQETILQSGVDIQSEEHLRQLAQHFLEQNEQA